MLNHGSHVELDDRKPTPYTLLLSIYGARLLLESIDAFQEVDFVKQCEYLQSSKLDSKSKRKSLLSELMENEANFEQLSSKSYLRIRFKHILFLFHRDTEYLSTSTDVSSWSGTQLILSFMAHLIQQSMEDKSANKKNTSNPKVWEFVNYLRRYFNEDSYDGTNFLAAFQDKNDPNKQTKGFGLQIMKSVCSRYSLKSGPFSKVKKQCNAWAQRIQRQSEGIDVENKQAKVDNVQMNGSNAHNMYNNGAPQDGSKAHNYSKFVTDVSMYVPQQQPVSSAYADDLNGKLWYWFNDSTGFEWVPYREVDIEKLHTAWKNNQKSCLVINGNYRVEFDRSDPSTPSGNQYNNQMPNPGGRTVICSKPSQTINGISVAKNPL